MSQGHTQHQPIQPTHQGQQSEGHQGHTGPTVVLFIIFGLLMGSVMRQINKKTKMPYTPMCLMLGIFLGYFKDSLGVIGDSTSIIEKLNPHMILLIFIPTLLFESAFNCDWHVVKKSMFNILILAAPGVLWGAILIGTCFKVILMYPQDELTWYQAFTLGCILSATDPVAVVALLKQLGASVRFNTLVQGQSLMNDGTAMVFFMLFMDLAKGNSSSAVGVLANFVRIAFGGPLFGILFGFLMSFWLKRIIRDDILAINITFVGAYACFYIAQFTWIKVSGILAVVVLGLYMSAVGKKKIYPESQHAMHSVWSYIQNSCQTLIFILTGCVVGVQMIQESTIRFSDWVKMFLFYILMIILRGVMILTFYPLIKNTGYGLTKKEFVVLVYGGLRGALGLCLSLMVGFDDQLPVRFRQLTVFYMCGMAMLTIIVNGLTSGKVVNYVQMIKVPAIKKKLFNNSIRKILQKTQEKLQQIKSQPDMAYANWKQVQEIAGTRKLAHIVHQKRASMISQRDSFKQIKKPQMVSQIRFKFTRYLQKLYWQQFQQGQISQQSVTILSNTCDIINDNPQLKLDHFQQLSRNFTMDVLKYYIKFKDAPLIGLYMTRQIVQKLYLNYQIATTYLQCSQEVVHIFKQSFPIKDKDNLNYVIQEIKEGMDMAIAYISQIQNGYPTVIQAVHTARAATVLLKHKKHVLKDMFEDGYFDETDYSSLRKQIDHGLIEVQIHDFKLEQVHFNSVLTQCPLFSVLNPQEIVNLRMKATDRTFDKNTIIQTKGKQFKNVYFVVSGTVKETFDDFSMIRGIGCVLNPYDFIYKETSKCIIRAQTQTKVMQIQQKAIWELLQKYPQFKKKWFKSTFLYSLKLSKGLDFLQKKFTDKETRRFIEGSQIRMLNVNDMLTLEDGGFIFQGQVQSDGQTYTKGQFISHDRSIQSLTKSTVLIFNEIVGLNIRSDERISILNQ